MSPGPARDPRPNSGYHHVREKAVTDARESLRRSATPGNKHTLAKALRNLAYAYFHGSQGIYDLEKQVTTNLEAAELYREIGDLYEAGRCLHGAGITFGSLGRIEESYKTQLKAHDILEKLCARKATVDAQVELMKNYLYTTIACGILEIFERSEEFERKGIELARLLSHVPAQKHVGLRHIALFVRGQGIRLIMQDRFREADKMLKKSLRLFNRLDKRFARDIATTYKEMARAQYGLGAFKKSCSLLDKGMALRNKSYHWDYYHKAKALHAMKRDADAMDALETAIGIIESRRCEVDFDDNRISFFMQFLVMYDCMIEWRMQVGETEKAFAYVARCKARVFTEALSGRTLPQAPAHTVAIKALRQALGKEEALLEYYLGRDESWMFLISPKHGLIAKRLDITVQQAAHDVGSLFGFVRQVNEPGSQASFNWHLQRLYRSLLAPVESELNGISRLFIVPNRDLYLLPFAALQDSQGRPLIERFTVSYLPASGLLTHKQKSKGKPAKYQFLALADPNGDLFYARDEAQEVAKLFKNAKVLVGDKAVKAAIGSSPCSTLHLACHGRYNEIDAFSSYLELAAGTGGDRLTVTDVYDLDLSVTALTFLSGCHTGRGRSQAGDEVTGFSRAFLLAGSKSVVVSLWDVEEAATKALVCDFYRNFSQGQTPAAALRVAQLKALKTNPHPYFWGAFQIQGV